MNTNSHQRMAIKRRGMHFPFCIFICLVVWGTTQEIQSTAQWNLPQCLCLMAARLRDHQWLTPWIWARLSTQWLAWHPRATLTWRWWRLSSSASRKSFKWCGWRHGCTSLPSTRRRWTRGSMTRASSRSSSSTWRMKNSASSKSRSSIRHTLNKSRSKIGRSSSRIGLQLNRR